MKNAQETICAVATPPGMGGIGVIKISGPEACAVPGRIFRSSKAVTAFRSHRLYHGFVVNPETGQTIDEVLLVVMRAPFTYTCEDVVEIQTHSSMAAINSILEQVLKLGIRAAEPGEFTRRAFLNGRIDLTQAEAVIDLIKSKTEKGLSLATHQMEGTLSEVVQRVRKSLIRILAQIEAMIDFPEDMEDENGADAGAALTAGVISPLKDLLGKYDTGHLFREGVEIIIIGRPNVGKSSLFNSFLRKERAIVTSVPGTTRDIIEEGLSIKGIPTRIIDTAGLHPTSDMVESAGIQFTKKRLSCADLILFILDISELLTPEDFSIFNEIRARKKIIVANKMDLVRAWSAKEISQHLCATDIVEISARFNTGIDRLVDVIYETITGSREMAPPSVAPNLRHKRAIERALAGGQAALSLMNEGESPALIAIELQEELDALGEITGETTSHEILDEIFSRFCIGK